MGCGCPRVPSCRMAIACFGKGSCQGRFGQRIRIVHGVLPLSGRGVTKSLWPSGVSRQPPAVITAPKLISRQVGFKRLRYGSSSARTGDHLSSTRVPSFAVSSRTPILIRPVPSSTPTKGSRRPLRGSNQPARSSNRPEGQPLCGAEAIARLGYRPGPSGPTISVGSEAWKIISPSESQK